MTPFFETIKRHFATFLWAFALLAGILLHQAPIAFRTDISRIAINSLYGPFSALNQRYHLLRDRRAENLRLKEELTRSRLRVEALKEAQRENERLRRLLGFSKTIDYYSVLAEVVGRGTPRIPGALLVGAGANDGVIVGLPVIDEHGIVGKVVGVYKETCLVEPLTDPNFKISVIDARSRIEGIVSSNPNGQPIMENVPVEADVRRGDAIVSSGLGKLFPKGLMVGRVSRVSVPQSGLFSKVEIKPAADLHRIEEVFILFSGIVGDVADSSDSAGGPER